MQVPAAEYNSARKKPADTQIFSAEKPPESDLSSKDDIRYAPGPFRGTNGCPAQFPRAATERAGNVERQRVASVGQRSMPMMGRRVTGFVVATAITLVLATVLRVRGVSAQDFTSPQNASAQPANPGAPDLFPPQNPGQGQPQSMPQNPTPPSDASSPEAAAANDPNTEVQTKGAMHEAFAQPVVFNPTPSAVVPKQPPDPVEEMPPEQKPAGDHVVWIAGYWSYEADGQKYVWTSGIWRAMPAGVEWVPGYWNPSDGGFQWVSGFWRKDNGQTQVTYLPQEPPKTLEQGPVGVAPTPDNIWVPGHWVWRVDHYAWRPGFWAAANPDWIWIPANYVWTPNGYVFVDGHWDYAMEHRGVFFAPVVFQPGFYIGPGFVYTPVVAMDFGVCTGCLFCRPGCYCFGDYYGPGFVSVGIYPWFAFHGRYGYDPCFAYYGWRNHGDPGWRNRLVVDYRFRIGHPDARPPHTYAAMIRGGGPAFAVHINTFAARGGGMRFERINAARRAEIHRAVREQHMANARRAEAERRGAREGGTGPRNTQIGKSALSASHGQTNAPAKQQQQTRQMPQRAAARQPARRAPARRPGEK
jgi:hypothetical protein